MHDNINVDTDIVEVKCPDISWVLFLLIVFILQLALFDYADYLFDDVDSQLKVVYLILFSCFMLVVYLISRTRLSRCFRPAIRQLITETLLGGVVTAIATTVRGLWILKIGNGSPLALSRLGVITAVVLGGVYVGFGYIRSKYCRRNCNGTITL